jgi:hypothetical protein
MYFYGLKNRMATKRTEMGKKLLSKGKSSNIEWTDRTKRKATKDIKKAA